MGSDDDVDDDVVDLLPDDLVIDPADDPANDLDDDDDDSSSPDGNGDHADSYESDTDETGPGVVDTEPGDTDDEDGTAEGGDGTAEGGDGTERSDTDAGDEDGDDDEALWGSALGLESLGEPSELTKIELSHWSTDSRRMLAGLLEARSIPSAWQGGELTTPTAEQDHVDRLLADVEHASEPRLDGDASKTVYEVAEWPLDAQAILASKLAEQGVAHEWDVEGDLVVHEADEDAVDAIFDGIEVAEPSDDDGDSAADEDLPDAQQVLTELFLSTGRLRRNPHDAEGVLGLLPAAEQAARIHLPFGFEPLVWRDLVGRVTELSDALEDDSNDDDEGIKDLARQLHRQLGEFV